MTMTPIIRPLKRILIANNGNSAVKAIRSMRQWAFENDADDLQFVVMSSPEDANACAEYIPHGSTIINVPGGSNANNYANVNLIIDTAVENNCDAIWPGWGHASENYHLPQKIERYNIKNPTRPIKWVGPSSESMFALGDKIGSTIIAQTADVPCVPWSGSQVRVEVADGQTVSAANLTEQHVNDASVSDWEQCLAAVEKIGLPVMIKAADGGGGKGIRKVDDGVVRRYGDLESAVKQSFREVCNEVKNSAVFVMKMLMNCRHLEVQVVADQYGNSWPLASRDCSIQRRCQKIIEEGPVVAAPSHVVKAMEDSAARLCKLVGYESAATCEFLYDPETQGYYFLEVNARLQVEHVVTEMNTETNLPAAQLQIAMGYPLHQITDVYNTYLCRQDAHCLPSKKHVIAARVTAEYAEEQFRPTCGSVDLLTFRPSADVWAYFSIKSGGKIHQFADSQFGHIFAQGKDRNDAIKKCIYALRQMDVRGSIRTNIRALITILSHEAYLTNKTHTTWLDNINFKHLYLQQKGAFDKRILAVVYGAVFRAATAFNGSKESFIERMSCGHVPEAICVETDVSFVIDNIQYHLMCRFTDENQLSVRLNDSVASVTFRDLKDHDKYSSYIITIENHQSTHVVFIPDDDAETLIVRSQDGWEETLSSDRDPSQIKTEVSGKLVRYMVEDGTPIVAGQAFAEIEVMKMFMQLKIPDNISGIFHPCYVEGSSFQIGTLIGTIELPDGFKRDALEVYQGPIPRCESTCAHSDGLSDHQTSSLSTNDTSNSTDSLQEMDPRVETYTELVRLFENVMKGYRVPYSTKSSDVVENIVRACTYPDLPKLLIKKYLTKCYDIDGKHIDEVNAILDPPGQDSSDDINVVLNNSVYHQVLDYFNSIDMDKSSDVYRFVQKISEAYEYTNQNCLLSVTISDLIDYYLRVEETLDAFYKEKPQYASMSEFGTFTSSGIRFLKDKAKKSILEIWDLTLGHLNYEIKNTLLGHLLHYISDEPTTLEYLSSQLTSLNALTLTKHYTGNNSTAGVSTSPTKSIKFDKSISSFFTRRPSDSEFTLSEINGNTNKENQTFKVIESQELDLKRAICTRSHTTYCYDFIPILESALINEWKRYQNRCEKCQDRIAYSPDEHPCHPKPDIVLSAEELIVDEGGSLVSTTRKPGCNTIGMVGWKITMRTPTSPNGRDIILIANDISFKAGSFGVLEDNLFFELSRLSRDLGIPRIYLTANSGARIGLDSQLSDHIQVAWTSPDNHTKGFEYLYLTKESYEEFKDYVAVEVINDDRYGEVYKLVGITGRDEHMGVENLAGSGKIAGETSRCYKENFTLTYVTGRTVGIGAYLTRLGQRVIQRRADAPILLTGYQALNKLIGGDVYKSNDDIGGIDVMFENGTSHQVVESDYKGVCKILEWLSFVPDTIESNSLEDVALGRGKSILYSSAADPIDRSPERDEARDDPRHMLKGWSDGCGMFHGGLFDRDSFVEYQERWAKGVIVGRARLGGRPIGCIAVETRSTDVKQPADPATLDSREVTAARPGQVWFPESAFKTAQAIKDFNNEGLPLIILANWRGFSGGQRDMYNEILKFGSMIVDALVEFKNPCFVYIPPKAELRGGAWVVVDPNINPNVMEMYADPTARGGILEPNAVVEIRFRNAKLKQLSERLGDGGENTKIYKQIAESYADLHDTPHRMLDTKAINRIVPWSESRAYFYWRLVRQDCIFAIRRQIKLALGSNINDNQLDAVIDSWATAVGIDFNNPREVQRWVKTSAASISSQIDHLQNESIRTHFQQNVLGEALLEVANFLD